MRDPVLMPRDGAAEPRLLDEYGVIEGHKILAVDCFRDCEEPRMTVESETRRH